MLNSKQTKKTTHTSKTVTWQVPVPGWNGLIDARGDNLVSSQYGMAKQQIKQKTPRPPGHTSEWVKQQSTMRKPGIPPARIPEITWHKPTRHNNSHKGTPEQTPATPGRSESGETQNRVRRKVKHELRWEKKNKPSTVFRAHLESAQ